MIISDCPIFLFILQYFSEVRLGGEYLLSAKIILVPQKYKIVFGALPKIEQKGMTFDQDFCYFFPHEKELAKIVIKSYTFLLDHYQIVYFTNMAIAILNFLYCSPQSQRSSNFWIIVDYRSLYLSFVHWSMPSLMYCSLSYIYSISNFKSSNKEKSNIAMAQLKFPCRYKFQF